MKKEKKKTDIAAVVIDAVAVLFDTILARGSIGVDGNQKAKKKKKNPLLVTLFPIHQFQFSIFSPSLCLFHFLLLLLKGPKNSMFIL